MGSLWVSYVEFFCFFYLYYFPWFEAFLPKFFKVIDLGFEQLSERQTGHSFCQINA